MTDDVPERFDRPDENLVKPNAPTHVAVKEDMRGSLDLRRDGSQHRRFTSFYDDLQNQDQSESKLPGVFQKNVSGLGPLGCGINSLCVHRRRRVVADGLLEELIQLKNVVHRLMRTSDW